MAELGVLQESGRPWWTPTAGGRGVPSAGSDGGCFTVELPLSLPSDMGGSRRWCSSASCLDCCSSFRSCLMSLGWFSCWCFVLHYRP
jgi:hypothetical protein